MVAPGGPVLPSAFVRELVGATSPERARFTDQILAALGKISPALVPTMFAHPLADFIVGGVGSLPALLAWLGRAASDDERAAIADAMAEIFVRENATREAVTALGQLIERTKSEAVASAAARALACARDPGFLEQQRNFLASPSPTELRRAALLLGHGRWAPAVPHLLELLRDDQLVIWDVVLWALGEIGDRSALPKLHRLLHAHLRTELVIEAIGKLGDPVSVVRLLPALIEGSRGERERAAQAIGKIARANDGELGDAELKRSLMLALERVIDQDDSSLARFHAIVALSWLGGALDPARVLAALGGQLGASELDAMASVLLKKGPAARAPQRSAPSAGGRGGPVGRPAPAKPPVQGPAAKAPPPGKGRKPV